MLLGLGAAGLMTLGVKWANVAAAVLFVGTYVLDNCDGEVARAKNQCSDFGMYFDTFVDWIVNTAFFVGLGWGAADVFEDVIWWWLGLSAGAGGTINYLLGLYFLRKDGSRATNPETNGPESPGGSVQPETWWQRLLFFFRELSRADFCFLVLALALADVLWLLLVAGAIGAHVYWMTQCIRVARKFRV